MTIKIFNDTCPEESQAKVGNIYKDVSNTRKDIALYILAQVDISKVVLISLYSGNRYTLPVEVDDPNDLPIDIMDKLSGKYGKFIHVNTLKIEEISYE